MNCIASSGRTPVLTLPTTSFSGTPAMQGTATQPRRIKRVGFMSFYVFVRSTRLLGRHFHHRDNVTETVEYRRHHRHPPRLLCDGNPLPSVEHLLHRRDHVL